MLVAETSTKVLENLRDQGNKVRALDHKGVIL